MALTFRRFWANIRLSDKFFSFYEEIIDARCFLFYIIFYDLFCSVEVNIATFHTLVFTLVYEAALL